MFVVFVVAGGAADPRVNAAPFPSVDCFSGLAVPDTSEFVF